MSTVIYGIKNCDTMKKAFAWLEASGHDFTFHDYKKHDLNEQVLRDALEQHGWENVINRRGTTWRQLPDTVKESMDADGAIDVAKDNPSIVKRPLLVHQGHIHLGFKDTAYAEIFGN